MGFLKVIEWKDDSQDTIVHKIDLKRDYVTKGSALTVRDSQVAIFADKGRMADVFLPGFYKLDTDNIPILTKLMSWKYGFESPFKSDIYFVNTKQFTNCKWGTMNPIIVRDAEFGAVRVRAFGTYAFRVKDAFVFMQELSGTNSTYETDDIIEYLRSMIVTNITDIVGDCGIPVLDMAGNLLEFGEKVRQLVAPKLDAIGIEITNFNFENFSMPENLEKALDKRTELAMMRSSMDVYTRMAQADAMVEAAKNPGGAGAMMGAGIGMGMGVGMGNAFGSMANSIQPQPVEETDTCPHCNSAVKKGAKFCANCGKPMADLCPNCGKPVVKGAKFCSECGTSLKKQCPKCGNEVTPGAKFCLNCGEKL